jgi:F-box-like
MPFLNFVDPPTKEALVNARRSLEATRASIEEITSKIDVAETTLAQLVRDSKFAINELEGQRTALEDQVSRTLAFLSPIRRLPMELLREIFVWSFEEHACSAWVLAAVCPSWRRLALRIPLIWSKVSLLMHSVNFSLGVSHGA